MRAYILTKFDGAGPDIIDLDVSGYALGASAGDWGMYLFVGTEDQIIAIDALPETLGICTVGQLEQIVSAAKRAEIDAWSDANFPSLPNVPADWTNDQIVRELYGRANNHYIHEAFFIKTGGFTDQDPIQTLAIGPKNPSNINTPINGDAWKLIDIDDYAIWQVDSDEDNLIELHGEMWELSPKQSLGLLAVVEIFGAHFYHRAVMNTFDHPASELAARRDRIADYLEDQEGHTNTTLLRAATDEHEQIEGIIEALGYSMSQLWEGMHE